MVFRKKKEVNEESQVGPEVVEQKETVDVVEEPFKLRQRVTETEPVIVDANGREFSTHEALVEVLNYVHQIKIFLEN